MSPDTAFFWEGVAAHRLLIQRCLQCGELRHPPRPMCPRCNALDWDSVESTGRGTVYSFVLPRHPRYPGFDDPHIVVLVELDEGVRMLGYLVDDAGSMLKTDGVAEGLTMGARVKLRFHEQAGFQLPSWTLGG